MLTRLLLLLVLTTLAYAPVRNAPFLYEDDATIASGLTLTRPTLAPGRWVTTATLVFDHRRGGSHAAYHQTNLALHLVNGLLVAALARRLRWSALGAVIAAGVFLLHPIQTEAVSYLSGRADLVMTAAVLLACLALAAHRIVVAAGLTLLALGTKEAAVAIIGLLPLVAWRTTPSRRWALLWIPAVLMAGVGLAHVEAINAQSGADPIRYLAAQLAVAWTYLGLVVWPRGFSLEHDVFALHPAFHLAALLATIIVGSLAWLHRQTAPRAAFCVGWVLLALAPRLVVQMPNGLYERQFSVAMVGVALAAGALATSREIVHE